MSSLNEKMNSMNEKTDSINEQTNSLNELINSMNIQNKCTDALLNIKYEFIKHKNAFINIEKFNL